MVENELEQPAIAVAQGNAPSALDEEDDSVDLGEVFRRLGREKGVILTITLGGLVIATAVAFLLPMRYTSTASFIPPATLGNGNSMAALIAGQLSSSLGGASDVLGGVRNPGDLYAGILKSHSIADEMIKKFDLMHVYKVKKLSLAEKRLGSDTNVTVDLKSSIVTVEVTAKSPDLSQNLANAYMDGLREANGRLALSQSSQRALFFGQQLAKEKDALADAEVDLKKTEERSGLIAPSGQTEAEIATMTQTQAQIAVREVQLAALRDSATDQNPDVVRLRSEIVDLQGQLARLQRGSANQSTATIPTSKVPEIELEYIRKEREVKYHEALFDMLSRQFEAARLDESRDAPVLQVLDSASYPDTKSFPKRSYFMLGGLLLGLIAGCGWVLGREHVQALRASLASGEAA